MIANPILSYLPQSKVIASIHEGLHTSITPVDISPPFAILRKDITKDSSGRKT